MRQVGKESGCLKVVKAIHPLIEHNRVLLFTWTHAIKMGGEIDGTEVEGY